MNVKTTFILGMLLLGMIHQGISQNRISGKVTDMSNGHTVRNALIKVLDSDAGTTSDSLGVFSLVIRELPVTLVITHVGYESVYWPLSSFPQKLLEIRLQDKTRELSEVVVSTGYQQIPRERMTGSFSQVDHELFNRRVSPDILSRLEDIVPGLVFNRRHGGNNISIRGRNTISGDGQPLIVVDNFPFEGDLSSINPNDIENVTVLRDAAASSIWGARAGNGVIVITTRKGGYQRAPMITFNANVTLSEKPDLYYQPQMSSADYIDWEKYMFQRGYYNSFLNSSTKPAFTPVVEVLFQQKDGLISESLATQQIEALKSYDVRKDMEKYLYQNTLNSQYALALSGGSVHQKYALSVGYDKLLAANVGDTRERLTISANHTYGLYNNKLELSTGVYYVSQHQQRNSPGQLNYTGINGAQSLYPYARLADEQGRPLITEKNHRLSYAGQAVKNGLLDWTYRPLEELAQSDNTTRARELRLRAALTYKMFSFLNAEVSYLYQNSSSFLRDHYSVETYYARDIINRFAQRQSDGSLTFPVPKGGILDRGLNSTEGYSLRGQLNFSKKVGVGELDAIGGTELRDHHIERVNSRLYGYDDEYSTATLVDYVTPFSYYVNPAGFRTPIPSNALQTYIVDRYLSYYSNAGYSIKKKYVLSGSARLDQSNLFGVKANQKGVPLWSAGLAWTASSEKFMNDMPFSYLRLRATYGYSGNVNKSLSAKTTAAFSPTDFLSLLPYATIQNPPNPTLRWERVKMLNFGLDFETRNGRVGGALEYYRKQGLDLFGQVPYAPSTGISTFSGNTAATNGQGLDVSLNIRATQGAVQWHINTLFSYVSDKITDFKVEYPARNFALSTESRGLPLVGKPQYALYSYAFAGIDPKTGDPLGYLDGQVSNQWGKIMQTTTVEKLQYHGSSRPVVYGSVRNNLSWNNITLSTNLSYRLGYYFRRASVNYASLWLGLPVHGDYERRWQKPGDEQLSDVPSNPGVLNTDRSTFYLYSGALVERADHLRLQDIQLSYNVAKLKLGSFEAQNTQIYAYANNLGILWGASKTDLDPDSPTSVFPLQRSLAIGIRFNL